ncbi:hypothetical protein KP509_10G032800 [Ceratopteris richardii]|uniref:RING-type domain-containing protein n=1 Tax=Ceratopteris richardii TaxID=49495 RepID=A0A8T2TY24_CERRI|nr:hypothetical protein KP509_10G032800 [Ceratopteris richardii]
MVVCKCRKATNLYCFVHKVPVCGECICSDDHKICVVRTYSEWVIDGDYDWPSKCSLCNEILQQGGKTTARLGCLHVLHLSCFTNHLKSFPPHTAPAGYVCPVCSTPIWPPKFVKDHNAALALKLKEIVSENGLTKSLLGNETLTSTPAIPPAIASANSAMANFSLVQGADSTKDNNEQFLAKPQYDAYRVQDAVSTSHNYIKESSEAVDDTSKAHSSLNMAALSKMANTATVNPGAMTRKTSTRMDKTGLNYIEFDGEDEDEASRKYNRRGPLQKQALKYLLPFSPNAMPTLPITAPSRKDDHNSYAEEIIEGRPRRRPRSSGLNTKKVLLLIAITSCMVTMLLLYYRLLQGAPSDNLPEFNSVQGQLH